MNHQQYETWILMDADLDREEHRDLHIHLKQCAQCLALYQTTKQIAHLFKTAPEPAPKPDFSTRWLDRIDKVEKQKNRLILFITTGVISLATLILISSVGIQLKSVMGTFPQILLNLITLIANWIVFINQLSDIFTPLLRVGAKLLSPMWLYTLAFGLSGITTFWTLAFYRSRTIKKELN